MSELLKLITAGHLAFLVGMATVYSAPADAPLYCDRLPCLPRRGSPGTRQGLTHQ